MHNMGWLLAIQFEGSQVPKGLHKPLTSMCLSGKFPKLVLVLVLLDMVVLMVLVPLVLMVLVSSVVVMLVLVHVSMVLVSVCLQLFC